jgi:uncharacterized membrane protein
VSAQSLSTATYGPLLKRSLARASLTSLGIVTAIFVLAAGPALMRDPQGFAHAFARTGTLHAPDIAPILAATPAIQIHLVTILAALAVTGVLMSGVKGSRLHRVLGWSWAIAMTGTAISAFFIKAGVGPTIMGFGFLHIFALITLISVPRAVLAARRHDVASHARVISGFVIGGLGIAGLAAFLPGRLMWAVFFG